MSSITSDIDACTEQLLNLIPSMAPEFRAPSGSPSKLNTGAPNPKIYNRGLNHYLYYFGDSFKGVFKGYYKESIRVL